MIVSQSVRSGGSAASRYRAAGGIIPSGSDIDHLLGLQLGGGDFLSNMWPLNSSVNISLGAQIQAQIRKFPHWLQDRLDHNWTVIMYDLFANGFSRDGELSSVCASSVPIGSPHAGLAELLTRFGGASFDRGLYRIMLPTEREQWTAPLSEAFPQFVRRSSVFAYDWLGRIFAIDSGRQEKDGCGVLLLEPGTGGALEIPCGIRSFHEEVLIHDREAPLAASFHAQWLEQGGKIPSRKQCVGYKKPLFLSGVDLVSNLELVDMDVYWTVSSLLIRKARGLPVGTRLGSISRVK